MLITRKKYVFSCLSTKKDLAPKNGGVGGGGGWGAGQRPPVTPSPNVYGPRWMSIERKSIWTVRVINECYLYFFSPGDLKFMV